MGASKISRSLVIKAIVLCSSFLFFAKPSLANWTLNLGYHNPPGSKVGVNFLYWTHPLMFEIGIGWIDVNSLDRDDEDSESDTDDLRVAVAGAINVKYMFSSGSIRPYFQVGVGAGSYVQAGDRNDLGAGIGGLYGGLGLMAGSPQFYAYAGLNMHANSKNAFGQFGIGIDI